MLVNKADIKLPERVSEHTCSLAVYTDSPVTNPKALLFRLVQTSVEEIMNARNNVKNYAAFPTVFAIRHENDSDVLMVWPKPDKLYEGNFRYCPAMKEI